mgnify:CR=1 FL=1
MKIKFLSFCVCLLMAFVTNGQARLKIINNSTRHITIKVMKGSGKGTLHEMVEVSAYNSYTVYFSASGTYFTKSKAVLAKKVPIYKKGKTFRVTNDESGYSILTLTYTIKESAIPESTGQTISKSEFDEN